MGKCYDINHFGATNSDGEEFTVYEGTVSQGSLRWQDTLWSSIGWAEDNGVAKVYWRPLFDWLLLGPEGYQEVYDLAEQLEENVVEELNRLCPEGWYFGSHPGDGADFGFWYTAGEEAEDRSKFCPDCDGGGYADGPNEILCSRCGGTGEV